MIWNRELKQSGKEAIWKAKLFRDLYIFYIYQIHVYDDPCTPNVIGIWVKDTSQIIFLHLKNFCNRHFGSILSYFWRKSIFSMPKRV
jgi:hypothetical protein